MERLGRRLIRDRKILASLLLVPLAVVFLGGGGMFWPDFFGSSRVMEASAAMLDSPPQIDGKRAYEYLKKICEIGPRTAGIRREHPPAGNGQGPLHKDGGRECANSPFR